MLHLIRSAVLLALAWLFLGATAATANTAEPVVGVDWFDYGNAANVVVIVGIFIPLITAVITKKVASGQVKSLSTLLLSVLTATVGTLVADDGGWAWRDFGNAFLSVFIPAIAAYYGLWKNLGMTRSLTEKTASFGVLGQKRTVETESRPHGPDPAELA